MAFKEPYTLSANSTKSNIGLLQATTGLEHYKSTPVFVLLCYMLK